MHKKRPRRQAIDNFIPSGRPLNQPTPRRRQQFPDVGVTMSSYSSYRGSLTPTPGYAPGRPIAGDGGVKGKSRRFGRGRERVRQQGQAQPQKKRWSKKRKALLIALPFIALILWVGIKFGWNAFQIFGNPFSIFNSTRLKGEEQGRVNILLAGNSADDVGHNGANLTDSIMIFSLDTHNHRAFLLSIPRDLYVNVPGHGYSKINAAYTMGQRDNFNEAGYAPGGMGLLQKTIAETVGVRTYYYALVNYSALKQAVNAVGGVTVNIHSSNPRGLYDPSIDWSTHGPLVNLSNGPHQLNGREALDLARARGDAPGSYGYAQSDFTRTQYQREILMALKDKAMSGGTLANPFRLTNLFDALGSNVQTDMNLGEVRRLHDLMGDVPDSSFKSYSLNDLNGTNYLASYRTTDGQSALIPAAGLDNFGPIRVAISRLMTNDQVSLENASVVVLNGTSGQGLADQNRSILESSGLTVSAVGNAKASQQTYIINLSGQQKPASLKFLENRYGTTVTTSNPYSGKYTKADFIVVLGTDRLARN